MPAGDFLSVQPGELKFALELKKQVSSSLRLVNITSEYVAFKVKTTSPKKYCVRPNTGVVPPQSSAEVTVTMQAQREMPADMQCKDKFLVQSVVVPQGSSGKDLSQDLFTKDDGKELREVKLRVVYTPPPQPPSPVAESPEEGGGFSPSAGGFKSAGGGGGAEGDGRPHPAANDAGPKDYAELRSKYTEARAMIASLTDERNSFKQQAQRLQQDMEKVRGSDLAGKDGSGGYKSYRAMAGKDKSAAAAAGFSVLFVLLAVLLAFGLGYYVK